MVLVVGNRKCSVIIALSARNEWDFVDASLPKPDVTSASFKSWSHCNYMIISWRHGALSKSIGHIITYVIYAHQIWLDLEDFTHMFGLHKKLNELFQENSNIAEYFTRFKMLWDDIDSFCPVPMCICGCKCGAPQKLLMFQ